MSLVLPVTLANCLALAGLPSATNAQMTALITLEQPALEFAIDPVLLSNSTTNAGLSALLTLGVSEVIAGDYVTSLYRVAQSSTVFKVSTLELETRPVNDLSKIGAMLIAQGAARLAPFLLSARSIARIAFAGDQNMDDGAPVDLSIGTGLGTPGNIGVVGPPGDPTFDAVLDVDGRTEPPGSDIFAPLFGYGMEGEFD